MKLQGAEECRGYIFSVIGFFEKEWISLSSTVVFDLQEMFVYLKENVLPLQLYGEVDKPCQY